MNRSRAPQWIVRLGFAFRCSDFVAVLAVRSTPVLDESLTPTDARHPDLVFYGSHFSTVELCQPLALAQRNLVPVCPVGGAQTQRSPGRYRFGGFPGGPLRSIQSQAPLLSATVAAVGTPFRSPIPLPKRAPP